MNVLFGRITDFIGRRERRVFSAIPFIIEALLKRGARYALRPSRAIKQGIEYRQVRIPANSREKWFEWLSSFLLRIWRRGTYWHEQEREEWNHDIQRHLAIVGVHLDGKNRELRGELALCRQTSLDDSGPI